jgi:hypothetical protein
MTNCVYLGRCAGVCILLGPSTVISVVSVSLLAAHVTVSCQLGAYMGTWKFHASQISILSLSVSNRGYSEQLCDIFISKESYNFWSTWDSFQTRNPLKFFPVYKSQLPARSWSSPLHTSLPSSLSSPRPQLLVLMLSAPRTLVCLFSSLTFIFHRWIDNTTLIL